MGKERLKEAFQWALTVERPDLVIALGFAGSLRAEIEVGDVFVGTRFLRLHNATVSGRPEDRVTLEPSSSLAEFCGKHGIGLARLVTTERPQPKGLLEQRFHDAPSLMDMESYFLCLYSLEEGIPFLAIRSVSDALDEEIDFELSAISDGQGRVVVARALLTAIQTPRLIRSFFHLWKNARKAAGSLAAVLVSLLSLPDGDLHRMVSGRTPWRPGGRDRYGSDEDTTPP